MPRPRRARRICFQPCATHFKPVGAPIRNLEESILTFDELEAVRLVDAEELGQVQAAEQMNISQATLSRLLASARKKLASAISKGNSIRVHGGDFEFVKPLGRGRGLRRGWR